MPLDPIPSPVQFRRMLGFAAGVAALLAPYVARAAAIPLRGEDWFLSYVPSLGAVIVAILSNAAHAATLFGLATSNTYPLISFWAAVLTSLLYVSVVHFAYFDLASSSTAGIGILSIPIYAAGIAIAVWWAVGAIVSRHRAG